MIPTSPGWQSAPPARGGALGRWWPPLALALGTALLQGVPSALRAQLSYDRVAVLEGQGWRLFTAHLVHLGWVHWAMNMAALLIVWAWLDGRLLRPCLGAVILVSAAAVGLGLLWLAPAVGGYVGLSGVLHGIFAAAGVWTLHGRPLAGLGLLGLLALKLAGEQVLGGSAVSEGAIGAPVIVEAHLYGALGGALAAGLCAVRTRAGWVTGPSD